MLLVVLMTVVLVQYAFADGSASKVDQVGEDESTRKDREHQEHLKTVEDKAKAKRRALAYKRKEVHREHMQEHQRKEPDLVAVHREVVEGAENVGAREYDGQDLVLLTVIFGAPVLGLFVYFKL